MRNSKSGRIAIGTLLVGLMMTSPGRAFFSHENVLTFSAPVALPGVVLPAGSYRFDVASETALDVVVVSSAKTSKRFYMGITSTVDRPRTMSASNPVTFGEAPAGAPTPISTWYEVGNPTGHQFRYR